MKKRVQWVKIPGGWRCQKNDAVGFVYIDVPGRRGRVKKKVCEERVLKAMKLAEEQSAQVLERLGQITTAAQEEEYLRCQIEG